MFCFRYGEIVNINLVRDKATGKSRGFAFICYEDQRSTILAVDNLNGIKVSNKFIYLTPSVPSPMSRFFNFLFYFLIYLKFQKIYISFWHPPICLFLQDFQLCDIRYTLPGKKITKFLPPRPCVLGVFSVHRY